MKIYNRYTKQLIIEVNNIKTDLKGADLWGADLKGADLKRADLWGADLKRADLREVNLRRADLKGADLKGANLEGADLEGVNLRGADLEGADLHIKNPPINDHNFISEILSREIVTENQIDFVARIKLQTNECWKYFIKLALKKKVYKWAYKILCQWEEFESHIKEIRKETKDE